MSGIRNRLLGLASAFLLSPLLATAAVAAEPVKIGVLHSLTGTMAISEITLKDTILMMVAEQNKKGGVLGRPIEAVVVDPKSDWPTFATAAEKLLGEDKVSAVFGCWTSVSRKHVLPVFEKRDGLLFYPVQYEGQEQSPNVVYTGATPNQQAIPAVEYLMSADGGSVKRFYLAGTDYVYPRTTNEILVNFLKTKGVAESDIIVNYTPFGHQDWAKIVTEIKDFAGKGKKTAVVSTINGDANTGFYNELAKQGITASDIPVMAFSVGEGELAGLDVTPLVGHLTAWNYFMSSDASENADFIARWQTFIKDELRVVNDPMEAHVMGFQLWVKAVEKAGSTDVAAVRAAMKGLTVRSLSGFDVIYDAETQHLHKPVVIGEILPSGQMQLVWKSPGLVEPKPWSPYMPAK
ncbi:urea ABC transporter substrate-binding protein [Skermanella stibiiresistens]|uniref:urea ABC transporter substrate-binding protein n=1 Tax=Skermanella stibiiresistens TaxID=913326 RepID=UPI000A034C89|nr:urea ABC transporter substrate-binding protein [Skermanella stibiiresistens]